MAAPLVLVTGASGFLAGHVIEQALQAGFRVRGTVRSIAKYADGSGGQVAVDAPVAVRAAHSGQFELVEAELSDPSGWQQAVHGCTFVVHVAAPVPAKDPLHESEVVRPAVEGVKHVLGAAMAAGTVLRVVLTSSTSAVYYGHTDKPPSYVFTERDWTVMDVPQASWAYNKSKTLAEQIAHKFVRGAPPTCFDLVVMNPCFILGPLRSQRTTASMSLITKLMDGSMPGVPDLHFNIVDVRDVAAAHVAALRSTTVCALQPASHPACPTDIDVSSHARHVLFSQGVHLHDAARVLSSRFAPLGFAVPTRALPSWVIWFASWFSGSLAMLYPKLGKTKCLSSDKVQQDLGVRFRPVHETLLDAAQDLVRRGLVRPKPRSRSSSRFAAILKNLRWRWMALLLVAVFLVRRFRS